MANEINCLIMSIITNNDDDFNDNISNISNENDVDDNNYKIVFLSITTSTYMLLALYSYWLFFKTLYALYLKNH